MIYVKKLILFHLIIFIGLTARPQSGNISGTVVETVSSEPLPFATVALFNDSDTLSAIQGSISDENGKFIFLQVGPGKYIVTVSFIGFKTFKTAIFLHERFTNLDTLHIETSQILLEDVTISGKQEIYSHDIDKKVYQVDQDILSESGSATEILQNIPSVTVDIEGNISLRGTSNILFLINGRPSALLRRSSSSALQQIPASTIERIEVITNPSAKYKPDGAGGIINIVLKKETQPGINGQVTVNVGNEQRYNGNLMLNYGTDKVNIFANYGLRHAPRTAYFTDERTYRDSTGTEVLTYYNETGNSKRTGLSHVISAGISYEINDNNSIDLSGTWYTQNSLHEGVSEISTDNASSQPLTRMTSNETNDEFEREGEGAFVWEHQFQEDEDHTLVFEVAFSSYDEEEDQTFDEQQTYPGPEDIIVNNLIQKSGNQTEVTLEYVKPLFEDAELEAGYVGEFIQEDIRYTNKLAPNRFLLSQNVNALYALYGQDIGNFGIKAGIRVEQTNVGSHLKEPTDSLVKNNYFKPYPTVHLAYSLTDHDEIALSYSKRINRPDADELNPYPEFSDPRSAEAGNPNLKPQQTHSIELGYHNQNKKYVFTPTLYYRYTYDAFTALKTSLGDTLVLTTIQNLDNQQSAGLELIFSGSPNKILDFNLSTNVFYDQIDATGLGYSDKKSVFSAEVKLYSVINITSTTMCQLNVYYYSPRITPQGQRNQYYFVNAGLKQQLFKKRAALTLTGTDIFHTYKISRDIESPELIQHTNYQRKSAVVYLGFTWFFNAQNNESNKELKFEGEGL